MTMGERIKYYRTKSDMTQEQLGELLGVQKSAIRKYEKGEVENIKRSTIKRMSEIFDISPCFLMGWDDDYEKVTKLALEVKLIEQIQKQYGKQAVELLEHFVELNEIGKEKAIDSLIDLCMIEKYTEKN